MVNDRSYFQTFLPTTERCHFADSAVNVEVAGKGTVVLRTPSGALQPLKDVLYVPSFSVNLISLSKADSNGLLGRWGNGTFPSRNQMVPLCCVQSCAMVCITQTVRRSGPSL
jgi:hypothetical protein